MILILSTRKKQKTKNREILPGNSILDPESLSWGQSLEKWLLLQFFNVSTIVEKVRDYVNPAPFRHSENFNHDKYR